MDINPKRFRQDCCTVSKAMIRLPRHDPSIPREDDGAARFDDIMEEYKAKFDGTSQDNSSGRGKRTKEKVSFNIV